MKTVEAWLDEYTQVAEKLLAVLNSAPDGYADEKLASVEAAVEMRQNLLEELAGLEIEESDKPVYAPALDAIKKMELEIESNIKIMMSELDAERLAIQDQRRELNRLKKANRSYAGTTKSTEGYFIDKKK